MGCFRFRFHVYDHPVAHSTYICHLIQFDNIAFKLVFAWLNTNNSSIPRRLQELSPNRFFPLVAEKDFFFFLTEEKPLSKKRISCRLCEKYCFLAFFVDASPNCFRLNQDYIILG